LVNFILPTFTNTMRLLNTLTRKIQEFLSESIPPYVILSHRWEGEEVLYKDLTKPKRNPSALKGWAKLMSFCSSAEEDGWEWVWMDTCCIDKSNSTELSEAINSMYQWYREAAFCIVYLADISVIEDETGTKRKHFHESEWFERVWTLQELLAPREVVFYDKSWKNIGTRTGLEAHVSRATKIRTGNLSRPLEASVAAKMSWASLRKTSRPEDIAYSLLGLFNVNMPLIYGEGERKAFQRLQYEIVRSRRDESIFAWTANDKLDYASMPAPGLLAPSPRYFSNSGELVPIDLDRAKVHAPRILFDGLVWTVERTFGTCDDREMLAPDEVPYIAPLACSKPWDAHAPVKLTLVISPFSPPRRVSSTSLDFFSENEMHNIRNSRARTYHLTQEQPRPNPFDPKPRDIRRGFTLRLSAKAQYQCTRPSKYGPDVELHTGLKTGDYVVLPSEENRDTVGVSMRHDTGAVIDVACHSTSLDKRRLVMKVNTQTFWTGLDFPDYSSGDKLINLGDRVIVSPKPGQNISISPKHGLRMGQNEIMVDIDCNSESSMDGKGIFSDDLVEGTNDNTDDFGMCASPHSSRR